MRTYKINDTSNNEKKIEFYPILYPNTDYFSNYQSILDYYKSILQVLNKDGYDIKKYLEDIKRNETSSFFYIERDFKVKRTLKKRTKLFESNKLINKNQEILFKIHFLKRQYLVVDPFEKKIFKTMLYINLEDVKIYITLNIIYIMDFVSDKNYCVYFDK